MFESFTEIALFGHMALKLYYSYGDLDYFKVVLLVEWLKVPSDTFIRINGKWALNKIMPFP